VTETVLVQFFLMFSGIVAAIMVTVRLMIRSNESIVRDFAHTLAQSLRESLDDLLKQHQQSHEHLLQAVNNGNQQILHEIREILRELRSGSSGSDSGQPRSRRRTADGD
jgi:glutamate mutase epsilon subunit